MAKQDADVEDPKESSRIFRSKDSLRRNSLYGHSCSARVMISHHHVKNAMSYQTIDLTTWRSLIYISYTVWNRLSLWLTLVKLLLVSVLVAGILICTVANPTSLEVSKFKTLSNCLHVFVGLLLGFFMGSSVKRWWHCAESFVMLGGLVRKMALILIAAGVGQNEIEHIVRYGILSAWLLHLELHVQALPSAEQQEDAENRWRAMRNGVYEQMSPRAERLALMLPEEADALEVADDPPGTCWIWIGSLLGQLAKEGGFKVFPAPSYAMCLAHSGKGVDQILKLRSTISVQAPFIYVHMLAALVHLNNIINAIGFGLTLGACVATWMVHSKKGHHKDTDVEVSEETKMVDVQSLIISFFFNSMGPLIYQALLEVGIAISQPFSDENTVIPTEDIIHVMENDIHEAIETSKRIRHPQAPKKVDAEEFDGDDGGDEGGDDDGGDADGDDGGD